MTAQIYKIERNKYFSAFFPEGRPYYYDFYLGEFCKWHAIKNTDNDFISLGGDKDNPIIYKYQETGITDFTFNILAIPYPTLKNDPNIDVWNLSSSAYFELWIDGIKPYYFYFGLQNETIFTRTVSVMANKGQTTKFKFRLTLNFLSYTDQVDNFYFEGKQDIVCSSITAKFIPDLPTINLENSLPIIVKKNSTLKKNRRYLVYALYAKILQLNLDEEDEFEVGDWIELKNMESGNFRLNSMKYDIVMKGKISRAKNGYIQSTLRGDFIRLECIEKSEYKIILSDTNTIGTFSIL